jgi:phospholipase/carboxylesterase
MNRRVFLTRTAAGGVGLWQTARQAAALPDLQTDTPYGANRLRLSNDQRQGIVYVPQTYKPGVAAPLLVMLHGLGGSSQGVRYTFPLADEFGVIVLGPESRDITWGQSAPGFDRDVRYIGEAYREVTEFLDVDRTHVALGGHSDGANYALAMGLAYGETFNHLMIFSAGMMTPFRKLGKPKIFISHGINDNQMPIDRTSRRFVPQLKEEGYDVTYREYEGGHGVSSAVVREAFQWFVSVKAGG